MTGKHAPIVALAPLALALAAQPAGANDTRNANVAVAQSELATLRNAMALVHADTAYLTTLENLDDQRGTNSLRPWDGIDDGGGALVIQVGRGTFEPARVNLTNRPTGLDWQGPYVNFQSGRTDDEVNPRYDVGSPLDPWGNPYLFFSPLGLLDPRAETVTLEYYGDDFGTYTIVSLGPDGVRSGDDLAVSLGVGTVTVPVISSVRVRFAGDGRRAGYEVEVRGYSFGQDQGAVEGSASGVLAVEEWTGTRITAFAGALPDPGETFTVTPASGGPLEFTGYLVEDTASVEDWFLY